MASRQGAADCPRKDIWDAREGGLETLEWQQLKAYLMGKNDSGRFHGLAQTESFAGRKQRTYLGQVKAPAHVERYLTELIEKASCKSWQ